MINFARKLPVAPTRQDFEYRTITPQELPGVMIRHIITGVMGSIYGTLTLPTGMFLVAFGNTIGVTIQQWGILTAFCSFAVVMQVVSAYWASRVGYRRLVWFIMESSSRLIRGAAVGLAFGLYLAGHKTAAGMTLVALLALGSFFSSAGTSLWFSWLADIIPERVHGTFMGRRDAWIALGTVGITVPLGFLYDRVPEDLKLHLLLFALGVGVLLGMIDLFMHRIIPEPPAARKIDGSFAEQVLAPLRNRDYRYWLMFTVFYNFAMFLGGSLATVYFVENLRIRDNFLGGSIVLIGVPLIGIMLTSRVTGKLIDRLGVRIVLIASHLLWAILPIFWVLAVPKTALFWLTVSSIIGGAASSAGVNAANKLVLRLPPRDQRAMYMATNSCLGNMSGGLASLVAGYGLAWFANWHWPFLGRECGAFEMLFLISLTLRLCAWLMLFWMRSPKFDMAKAELSA